MSLKQCLLVSFLLCPLLLLAQAKPYRIHAIKAYLYYNTENNNGLKVRGTLSENLVDNADFALWNTIIGEGSAAAASNQTLVVVELAGNQPSYSERQIVLTVSTAGKQIFRQEQPFALYDKQQFYSAAFLLYNTGCDPLTLKAEIVHETRGASKNRRQVLSSLVKKLPFTCGE